MGYVCRASIVADGGVFSPSMALGGGLEEARLSVLPEPSLDGGVGVAALEGEEKKSVSTSFLGPGVIDPARVRSGDLSGDLLPSK